MQTEFYARRELDKAMQAGVTAEDYCKLAQSLGWIVLNKFEGDEPALAPIHWGKYEKVKRASQDIKFFLLLPQQGPER